MYSRTNFISAYIISLNERTRNESSDLKIGFDWIIYNLGIAKGWTPVELPFFRSQEQKEFKTKTKPQFGIDISFINEKELIIFVLKDEVLNNKNFIKNDFDKDLRMASAPDLTDYNKGDILKVKVILAYNKDEDDTGIQLFDNLINALPSMIYDNIKIDYDRWNLTSIVEEVNEYLLTPDLLPQHLSSLLNYICSLLKDIEIGSEEWDKILIPNWKNFLNILFSNRVDEKRLRLIPVTLFIIDNFRSKQNSATYTGWIDLIEWGIMVALEKIDGIDKPELRNIVFVELWHSLYLAELEKYLITNQNIFYIEHAIYSSNKVGNLSSLNDSYLIYWT